MAAGRSVRHTGDARMLRAVRWRLVVFSAGSTLVLLLVLGTAIYLSALASLSANAVDQLDARVNEARGFLEGQPRPQPEEDERFGQFLFGGPASGTALILVDDEGDLIQRSDAPIVSADLPVRDGLEAALAGERDLRTATIRTGASDETTPVRVLSERIDLDGEAYVVQALQDRTTEVRTLNVLVAVLAIGGLGVLGAATAFGFVYAGRALVPIRDSLRRQRQFAADASHELRTPLTVVRGSVEHLRRHGDEPVSEMGTTLDDIDAEVGHLTGLVDDLLLLARSDSGVLELQVSELDLSDVVGEALGGLRSRAAAAEVGLILDAAPAPMRGDADRLRQLATILVDNAIRHSPAAGEVRVQVWSGPGHRRLVVEDEGIGIRPGDLAHVFDRFWRASDAPAGGTGLGLSIAAWIVERHGGSIRAANRADRTGARFEADFPA